MKATECWICRAACEPFASGQILTHSVPFFRCPNCSSVRTADPTWLDEAYSRPTPDVGLVNRNLHYAWLAARVHSVLDRSGPILDYGGGTGLLVRLLRDRGVDAWWNDPMAQNQFAQGFEAELSTRRWTMVTAIEVMEHIPSTADIVEQIMGVTDCLLISTLPIPRQTPGLDDWWYYLLGEGQHVSFPTIDGFRLLAERSGARLLSSGSTHLIVRASRTRRTALLPLLNLARAVAKARSMRRSLLGQDAAALGLKIDDERV